MLLCKQGTLHPQVEEVSSSVVWFVIGISCNQDSFSTYLIIALRATVLPRDFSYISISLELNACVAWNRLSFAS